jgi:hypothetical protein
MPRIAATLYIVPPDQLEGVAREPDEADLRRGLIRTDDIALMWDHDGERTWIEDENGGGMLVHESFESLSARVMQAESPYTAWKAQPVPAQNGR